MVEVFCTTKVEGLHQWSGCPHEEVAYLRDAHRHLFGIKAFKRVEHHDRDTEFIMLKHNIEMYIKKQYYQHDMKLCVFGERSCEMIADELITTFGLSRCEIDEDGENGAVVYRE